MLRLVNDLLKQPRLKQAPFTDLSPLFAGALNSIERRSLVFIVSDFISAPGWERPLHLLNRRNEVIAVRLWDPREIELPDVGPIVMEDAETGEQLYVDTHDKKFRARFAEAARRRESDLNESFKHAGVDILSTLPPPPIGDVDLAQAKARFGHKLCFNGNVDLLDGGTVNDILTLAYGTSGESLWAQRYDGSAHNEDYARAIVFADDRVLVTGGTTNASVLTDFFTASYSASGAEQWSATFDAGAAGNDQGLVAAMDSGGNVYVAGYQTSQTAGWDFAVLKYDAGGARKWVGTYSTPDEDIVTGVAVDAAGNVYAAGNSGSPYTLSWDYVTARYDASSGDTLWVRRLNGTADEDDEIRRRQSRSAPSE